MPSAFSDLHRRTPCTLHVPTCAIITLYSGVLHQPRERHDPVGLAVFHGHFWGLWRLRSPEVERQFAARPARVFELAGKKNHES